MRLEHFVKGEHESQLPTFSDTIRMFILSRIFSLYTFKCVYMLIQMKCSGKKVKSIYIYFSYLLRKITKMGLFYFSCRHFTKHGFVLRCSLVCLFVGSHSLIGFQCCLSSLLNLIHWCGHIICTNIWIKMNRNVYSLKYSEIVLYF